MKAIRGATTVSADTPEEIRGAVKELLEEIRTKNNLKAEDIIYIVFTSTSDITSFYPAKAAREAGFDACPLFSALEPPIKGSLPLCIRVLVLTSAENAVHVYLRGAVKLRKDLAGRLVIALDGPAGSGKSTTAKNLAKYFNILYLDTGAMYRACALECEKRGINVSDETSVKSVMDGLDLKIEYAEGRQVTILDGIDVSEEIRRPEISQMASKVSAFGCVRRKMVEMQRRIAATMSCVMDGRDIGTNVLPNTEHKFYVTASAEVRAKRRYDEDKAKGYDVSYENILNEIRERDKRDTEREIAPLRCADDAVIVDTSFMTPEEVVEYIKNKIQEKV